MPFDPKDPEAQAAIAAAVEAAIAPLTAKRDELLGEVKKLRKSAEISPEQLATVEAERDKLAADLQAAQKAAKDATKAAETAAKQFTDESQFTQRLLIDHGLTEALTAHGITNPVHLKAAQALLRSGVQIVADGDKRIAKFGDKPLADAVKEWAAGDEGKYFVSAPNNSGGGAAGGGKSGGGAADAMKLSPLARMDAGRKLKSA